MIHAARNARIIEARRTGLGPREIARQLDLSPNIVAGVLHRAGLARELRGRGYGLSDEQRGDVLHDAAAMGVTAAAREHLLTPSTIYKWRKAQAGAPA